MNLSHIYLAVSLALKKCTLLLESEILYLVKFMMSSYVTRMLYMSSSFWLLRVESREFSQAEKERTASKAEQIHKMTTLFTQNDSLGSFSVVLIT